MKWIQTHALTARQQEQIRSLQETCRRAEPFGHSVFLSGELNHFGEMDCFFLGYEGYCPTGVRGMTGASRRAAKAKRPTAKWTWAMRGRRWRPF